MTSAQLPGLSIVPPVGADVSSAWTAPGRLDALRAYDILDTPGEAAFDEIAELAAHLCRAPMASVSFLDSARQWHKSNIGLPQSQVGLEDSFCARARTEDTLMVIPDAREDSRFRANPLVTQSPYVRFYAGAPLVTPDGFVLGTLCVLDTKPRSLSSSQRRHLQVLARQVIGQLELRRQARALATEFSARLEADVLLRNNERILDGVLRHTDVLVYAKDLDGTFILANTVLEQTLAVPGGLRGKSDSDLFPPEVAEKYQANDAQIARQRRREVFQETLVHPDGSLHQYRSTKFPLFGDAGEVYAIAGVSTDVTELSDARSALQESEQRWRALVERSPVAVAVIDGEARFAYANPEAIRLYGADPDQPFLGRNALDFVPSGEHASTVELFGSVLSGAQSLHNYRWQLLQPGGRELTVEVNATAVTYLGRPAVQTELRDVTTKAAAEQAVSDSERRFRAIFTGSPIAMAISDETGRWVDTNAALGHLVGVDPQELIGQSATDHTHPEDRAVVAAAEQGQQDSPAGIHQLEIRFVRPDGEIRWAWVSVTPTPGPDGQRWTLAIAQDVTARKTVEAALKDSESELAAIATVARCVQAGEDPRTVVVDTVRRLSGSSTVSMLEEKDADTLVVTTCSGIDAVGISVSLAETSMTGHVWKTGEAVFLAEADKNALVNPALLAIDRTVSALWQPVVVEGKVCAVLNVTWKYLVADLTDRAVHAVQVIADEAAISLRASRMRQELEQSALTDPLTGLPNRRAWDARLLTLSRHAATTAEPLTVAVIDLDHFKSYNDTFGHAAGDLFLREFGRQARASLRGGDVIARWGGEEFILALPNTHAEQAETVLDRIRHCVPRERTCSVGYATWRPDETMTACIARADVALYRAKSNGRNQLALG